MARVFDYTKMQPRKPTMDKAGIAECPQCHRLGKYRKLPSVMIYTHRAEQGGTGGDMRAVPVDECRVEAEEVRA